MGFNIPKPVEMNYCFNSQWLYYNVQAYIKSYYFVKNITGDDHNNLKSRAHETTTNFD